MTAARKKRRKFALRKIKNNAGKGYAAGWINLCASGAKRAYMPCKFDYSRLSCRLLKFEVYKIWPSLSAFRSARLCKFDSFGFCVAGKFGVKFKARKFGRLLFFSCNARRDGEICFVKAVLPQRSEICLKRLVCKSSAKRAFKVKFTHIPDLSSRQPPCESPRYLSQVPGFSRRQTLCWSPS